MKQLTVQNIMEMVEGVKEFNTIMGNSLEDKNLIKTYRHLTEEEFFGQSEFYQSYLKGDKDGSLDGMIDLIYVSFYWYLLHGYTFKEVYIEQLIKESDMTSLKTDVADLKGLIEQGLSYYVVNTLIRILAKTETNTQFGIMDAFNNIRESNLSKVILKGTVDIDKELSIIESKGRYKDITVQEVTNDDKVYLCFKAGEDTENNVKFSSPKIIKTSRFVEPSLSKFIY